MKSFRNKIIYIIHIISFTYIGIVTFFLLSSLLLNFFVSLFFTLELVLEVKLCSILA